MSLFFLKTGPQFHHFELIPVSSATLGSEWTAYKLQKANNVNYDAETLVLWGFAS